MEFRTLWNILFSKQPQPQPDNITQLKLLNSMPIQTNYSGEAYNTDYVRACVHTIASHCAKLKPKHIRKIDGVTQEMDSGIQHLLEYHPNPWMNAYDCLYKTVSNLLMTNNAFLYVQTVAGNAVGVYPVNYSTLELLESNGDIYCKFLFHNGQPVIIPYSELIHIRRHFCFNDMFGSDAKAHLNNALTTLDVSDQGIQAWISNNTGLRGILKFANTMLKPSDLQKERDRFVSDYFNISNQGGIASLDGKADFIQLKNTESAIDYQLLDYQKNRIYNSFNLNQDILQSKYDENTWNAFYEQTIEPIAIQLSLEFTNKFFTDREKGFGNEIIFSANRLQFASYHTKTQLAMNLLPMGVFSINEIREIFNLSPVEDGDRRLQSLNFVDATEINNYQGVGGQGNVKDSQNTTDANKSTTGE